MNKLEVGMYVRTDEGIRKILREYDGGYELNKSLHYLYPEGHDLYEEDLNDEIIGEPSFNIIDLIEVGDYVNGSKVIEVDFDAEEEKYIRIDKAQDGLKTILRNNDIKLIVTREMFEQMKYEVE